MGRKQKGTNAEREIIHMFWGTGTWAAFRAAGSGSIKYPTPDIIASNGQKIYAIECKASKEPHKYLKKKEVEELKTFSALFGAEAIIAVKFNNKGWYFIGTEKLRETEKSFMINHQTAEQIGKKFEDLAMTLQNSQKPL